MIRKRGKMGQPVKNGTRYKKCTLVICIVGILVKVKYSKATVVFFLKTHG